jgi:hypothetical protein
LFFAISFFSFRSSLTKNFIFLFFFFFVIFSSSSSSFFFFFLFFFCFLLLQFHRIQLVHRFISKAGCDQRAGRTGRVRPGKVWRLYTKKMGIAMDEFDPPEIQQTPLEHVIIQLKTALNTNIIPVLQNVISPPDLRHIQPSFNELFRMRYIENASDEADLTEDGRIAAALGKNLGKNGCCFFFVFCGWN